MHVMDTVADGLVKTEENSFEYKQRALLETIVIYTFSRHAKLASYAKHS